MKMYREDVVRVLNAMSIHDTATTKAGGCEQFSMVVHDRNKIVLGEVKNDEHGSTMFEMIKAKSK
jgi:hypothetical protein